jgi:hypothetical protein
LAAAILLGAVAAGARGADVRPTRFTCYPAQFSAFHARKVTLGDAGSKQAAVVDLPEAICAPGGNGGSADYLTCYRLSVDAVPRPLTAADEFGRLSLRPAKAATLCLPSARVDAAGVAPSPNGDRLACYTAVPAQPVKRDGVMVEDGFGRSKDGVGGPVRVCTPVSLNGAAVAGRSGLTCYDLQSETKGSTVVIRNDWGYLKASLGPRTRLCTTATIGG